MNSAILATAVIWSTPQAVIHENPEREAAKAIGKALYIETGLNQKVKTWEKKVIPEKLKKYGTWPVLVIKTMTEKRITYEWTF